jgi:hypothetical protein
MDATKRAAPFVLLVTGAGCAGAQSAPTCADAGDLKQMVQTEYAFSERAQSSVRDAFLEYLAEDSLVLGPGPTPGRAFYDAAKPSSDKLEWYPAAAAAGGDLGFTTGPWIYTGADGSHAYGHFVTVWKRGAECRWRAEFDGGISHAAPSPPEPKLVPAALISSRAPPPQILVSQDAVDKAIGDFERTAQQDGIAAGLRTYGRDGDFRFYIEGAAPMNAGAASERLKGGSLIGSWSESARGKSMDATLAFRVGQFTDIKQGVRHSYVQIWQYDPKVANWGLRLFLQSP